MNNSVQTVKIISIIVSSMEGETKVTKIKSVRCPYNSSHVMTLDKLGSHILKCSFRTNEFVSCKYNTLHIYRQGFIEEHERSSD